MQPHELSPLIEALLFVVNQPLTVSALVKAVDDDDVGASEVKQVLDGLMHNYDTHPRGFKLVRLGNGYQILTRELCIGNGIGYRDGYQYGDNGSYGSSN